MRILITGAAGFIGSHVADAALAAGHDVRGLDSLAPAVHDGRPGYWPAAAELVTADVRDPGAVRRALAGVDAVCHQAALVGLGVDLSDLPPYCDVNVTGTAVLLEAMGALGVPRLVLASSMVAYGEGRYDCPEHGPVRPPARARADLERGRFEPRCPTCGADLRTATVPESAPLDPRNTYAVSKVAQEQLAGVWANMTGGAAIALRYHNVYGPRMPRDTPYSGVAAIFRSALEAGRAPRVFEDGGQLRDFVHVTDVAAANLAALDAVAGTGTGAGAGTGTGTGTGAAAGAGAGAAASTAAARPASAAGTAGAGPSADAGTGAGSLRAYNVASGQPCTIGEMAAALAGAFGGPAPEVTGQFRVGDVRHVVASPELAGSELGFRASISFRQGMAQFAHAPLRNPARRPQLAPLTSAG